MQTFEAKRAANGSQNKRKTSVIDVYLNLVVFINMDSSFSQKRDISQHKHLIFESEREGKFPKNGLIFNMLTVLTFFKKKKKFLSSFKFWFFHKNAVLVINILTKRQLGGRHTEKGWTLTVFRIPDILIRIRIIRYGTYIG